MALGWEIVWSNGLPKGVGFVSTLILYRSLYVPQVMTCFKAELYLPVTVSNHVTRKLSFMQCGLIGLYTPCILQLSLIHI